MPGKVTLKEAAQFKLIGKSLTRIEAPSKLDGTAVFGIDAHPPGLLHASVVMCPTRGGKVVRFDAAAAQKLPGVKHVVEVAPYHGGTGGVAVIADTPWHAKKAVALRNRKHVLSPNLQPGLHPSLHPSPSWQAR